jgi:glycosyltransferase involved in cell wall biosynthesis
MISVCILCKNGAATLKRALESVKLFPEVLLLDTGSTDESVEIAKNYPNVTVFQCPFVGFGPLRNQLASWATNDWILVLDTDEEILSPLLEEIGSVDLSSACAYSMPRDNYYNGKHIKGCGWSPDRVTRLYHRKKTNYSDDLVHESVQAQNVIKLINPIRHVPFRSTTEFLNKMQAYSTLYAQQSSKKSGLVKAISHSFFAFFRSYFLRRGFILGREGFIISLYNSNSVFYKYVKLWEKNREQNL